MHPFINATAFLFALTPTAILATTVHRCEDINGKVTFTHLGCRTDQQLHLQNADNPPPSGAISAPTSKPEKNAKKAKKGEPAEKQQAVVGIGQREDGCGNLVTLSARRKAMINKEVKEGMSRADVESMLGKPDTISSQNGNVRYNYVDKKDKGRKRTVTFNADGCVKP